MHKIYTSRYINTISLIITVIIFLISNTIYYIIQNPKILQIGIKNTVKVEFDDKTNISQNTTKENENNKNKEKTNSTNQTKEEKQAKTENATTKETNIKEKQWYLKIPRIFLEAEIAEGTTTEVMNTYIGHFEESAKKEGNICLAAHNRGYPVNYFQNLKLLKKGDKIEYKYQNFKKEYLRLTDAMEELEQTLSKQQKEQFDEIVQLFYKTEEYYFAFSYSLGVKYGEDLKRI